MFPEDMNSRSPDDAYRIVTSSNVAAAYVAIEWMIQTGLVVGCLQ